MRPLYENQVAGQFLSTVNCKFSDVIYLLTQFFHNTMCGRLQLRAFQSEFERKRLINANTVSGNSITPTYSTACAAFFLNADTTIDRSHVLI